MSVNGTLVVHEHGEKPVTLVQALTTRPLTPMIRGYKRDIPMKHQRDLGLRHPKVRRAYWAMFADNLEFNEDHLNFLKDRHTRYLQSLK